MQKLTDHKKYSSKYTMCIVDNNKALKSSYSELSLFIDYYYYSYYFPDSVSS